VYFKDYNPALKEYLKKVFKGEVVSKHPPSRLTLENIYKRISAKKAVVKFVRANHILPLIANNLQVKGMFFVILHPRSTIASQLEARTTRYLPENVPLPKKIVSSSISEIRELRDNEELIKKIKTIKTQEETLGAISSIDNYLPRYYQRKFRWYTLVYESLVTNPEGEIENMFSYINEKAPRDVYSKIRIPSRTTHDQTYVGTTKQLIKWKEKLSERQVKNILKVVQWFGLDFYTEDPEPNYDALKN